VKPILWGR